MSKKTKRSAPPEPTKPKTYWVVESGGLAGGVKVIFEYATHLQALGYPQVILSLDVRPDWFPWDHRRKIEWVRTQTYPALIEVAKGMVQPEDAVIATWWKTAFTTRSIVEPTGARGLYLVQDIETFYYFDPVSQNNVMRTYNLGLECFTTSKWVAEQLPNCTYVGIAIGRWREQQPRGGHRSRTGLAVARPQALKGYRQLTEVVRRLSKDSVAFVTFGVWNLASFHKWHHHVERPTDKAIEKLYSNCGVFLSTSLHEGLSMTPLEAMACGIPVVMFDAHGNREYFRDGENCLIAKDPIDMTAKVLSILGDRALAKKLHDGGQKTARQYEDWGGPVGRLAAFLDSPRQIPEIPAEMPT